MKFALLLTFLFLSCSKDYVYKNPRLWSYVYTLSETDKRNHYEIYDREICCTDKSFRFIIYSPMMSEDNLIYLDMKIINKLASSIVFDPSGVYYESIPVNPKLSPRTYAIDPDTYIANLETNKKMVLNYDSLIERDSDSKIDEYDRKIEMFSRFPLKKQVIYGNKSIYVKLLFPIDPKCRKIILKIPINNNESVMTFNQTEFD